MDQFMEEVVAPRKRGLQSLFLILANILWVLFGAYGYMQLMSVVNYIASEGFQWQVLIFAGQAIVFGGLAVLIFLRRDRLKTEYEYTFTNGQMDFAQVFNNKKRKNLGTMNIRNVEACGLVSSGSFQRYINQQGIKRTNWFLNREAELLYFYFQKDNQKRIIIIEPSQDMIAMIRRTLPQGVWQNN